MGASFTRTFLQCDLHPERTRPAAEVSFVLNTATPKNPADFGSLEKLKATTFPKDSIVNVVGFASSLGPPDYNLELSEKRATYVTEVIDHPKIRTFSLGEIIHPFDDQSDPEESSKKRESRRLRAVVLVCAKDADSSRIAQTVHNDLQPSPQIAAMNP